MAIEGSGSGGHDRGADLAKLAALGAGGYAAYEFLYKPYALQKERERLAAEELARNMNKGMSLKDATTGALTGACMAAAAAYKIPPEASNASCQGIAVLATKGVELAVKGAAIVGKAVGKGTVAATKAVGRATVASGKAVGKATVAVVYKAPKAVIGGTVNKTDELLTKAVHAVLPNVVEKAISRVVPKPVKKVATVTKKVVKKVLCLGFLCGIDGLDDDATISYLSAIAPQHHTRRMLTQLSAADVPRWGLNAPQGARSVRGPGISRTGKRPAAARSVSRRGVSRAASSGAAFYARHL